MDSNILSNDFLGNLGELTKSLQNLQNTDSNIDLTGIEESEVEQHIDQHGEFKNAVKELAKIEDMVKEYNELIRKLKKKKDELRSKTIEHMIKHEIDVAEMSNNDKFSLVTIKRTVNPITKNRISENLTKYFVNEEKIDSKKAEERSKKIFDWLYKTAEKTTDQSLRRYRKKS